MSLLKPQKKISASIKNLVKNLENQFISSTKISQLLKVELSKLAPGLLTVCQLVWLSGKEKLEAISETEIPSFNIQSPEIPKLHITSSLRPMI